MAKRMKEEKAPKEKLGVMIDRMYDLQAQIKKAEKGVSELKKDKALIESRLLKRFGTDDIDGCKGKRGVARISTTQHPSIKERKKFLKYVVRNEAFDLFQNRIASKAYFDRIDEGEEIPGVGVFEKVSVRVTKRGSK